MPVSPIDESESLSQSGVTERACEGNKEAEGSKDAMEEEEEEEEDKESKEGRKSVGRNSPKEPTKAEKEDHERTHCPYRSSCEHCVRARARNRHHRRQVPEEPLEEVKVPRVHFDYFFMSREDEEACKNPLLVMADERSGSKYARAVGMKGLGEANSMD